MALADGTARHAPGPGRVWSVEALLLATGDALAARFGAVAVQGELSGFSRASSGHCYFGLKDANGGAALLRCAMFRRAASLLDFAPGEGQQVELRGRLGVYETRGELQLVVESMRRLGAGALYEELLRRRARLEAEGLFEPGRKRPLPAFPRRVGVITSLAAAALRDVVIALSRRAPHVQVIVYPAPVQGPEAPAALAEALRLAARRGEADLLLLVRGGGSLEDLWAFNDERVVRAVAESPLPVVCGVGHETDVTLADLAADLRAATPTAAAELAAPVAAELLQLLDALEERRSRALQRALDSAGQRLDTLALRLGQPGRVVLAQHARLDALARRLALAPGPAIARGHERVGRAQLRLGQAVALALQRRHAVLESAAARLQALDPARVLQRGYAWIEDATGRPVPAVAALQPGQTVQAVWADGRADARIERVHPQPGAEVGSPSPPPPVRRRRGA